MAVAVALLVRDCFDRLVGPRASFETGAVLLYASGITTAILAGAWLRWRGNLDAEKLGQSYVHAVRLRLFGHVTNLGADGVSQRSRGAIMLRFVGDLTALRQWVSLGLAGLTVSGLATVLALVALTLIEPVIAISVAVALTIAAALVLAIGPRLQSATRDARHHRGRLAAMLNDRIAHIAVVESFGQEGREWLRFRTLSRKMRNALIDRARLIGFLRAASEASGSVASMCALLVGALQVAAGRTGPGAVVGAMVVASLLAPRLNELGRAYQYWNGAVIARRKQEEVLRMRSPSRPAKRRSHRLEPGRGRVELVGVRHASLFDELNLVIEAREHVALIGPNGSGKSTLLRLIAGIIVPLEGWVLLDGQDLASCVWDDVRSAFAIVAADLPLLRGSLRFNLRYGAPDASDADMMRVVELCGLKPLIGRLPEGLNSRVSEHGEGLSTGERARIALARALLVRPRVLLLDEADANMDAAARGALEHVLREFEGTVVFVAQDADRLAAVDRVLRLEAGRITLHRQGSGRASASAAAATLHPRALTAAS